jgi:hypothetical protein
MNVSPPASECFLVRISTLSSSSEPTSYDLAMKRAPPVVCNPRLFKAYTCVLTYLPTSDLSQDLESRRSSVTSLTSSRNRVSPYLILPAIAVAIFLVGIPIALIAYIQRNLWESDGWRTITVFETAPIALSISQVGSHLISNTVSHSQAWKIDLSLNHYRYLL